MIVIREASLDDVESIFELWKELMDFHRDLDEAFTRREDWQSYFMYFIVDCIESEDAQVLVAISDDKVIGFSNSRIMELPPVFKDEKIGQIFDIMVKEGYRNEGIGEKMLSKILQWFKGKRIERIELKVASANELGCSFWRKMGFAEYMKVMRLEKTNLELSHNQ